MKNALMVLLYLHLCLRITPPIKYRLIDFKIAKSLFSFGGWLSLHNIGSYAIIFCERFIIGIVLPLTSVAYYTVPFEIVGKLSIIPLSVIMVLFPSFSMLKTLDAKRLELFFVHALKYLAIIMGFFLLILLSFSKEILVLYVGVEFQKSSVVLNILSYAVLLSMITWLFSILLQGVGNVRELAIVVLLMAPLHIIITWFLTNRFGIEGAALSGTLQRILTIILFYIICIKLNILRHKWKDVYSIFKPVLFFLFTSVILFTFKLFVGTALFIKIIFTLLLIIFYITGGWLFVFNNDDRRFMATIIKDVTAYCNSSLKTKIVKV
jgi:O-antigen/teichoic acid export membrane protein